MSRLVKSLAHEIFHRMEPYGQVRDSQYEEFTAIYLGTQISGSTWQSFKGYDPERSSLPGALVQPSQTVLVSRSACLPTKSGCLNRFIHTKRLHPGGGPDLHDDPGRTGELPDRRCKQRYS